jgi:hypothetical protein
MADIIKIDNTNIISILHGGALDIGKPFSRQIYLIDVHIAGTSYIDNLDELEPGLTQGKKLNFFREPENPYDSLAIAIRDDKGNKLGYVPRAKNEILARLMDAGKLLYGTIFTKEYVGNWLKITLQIYLDD